MAKTATTATKKARKFNGDLPSIRKAIDKVGRQVEAGRKKAAAAVAKGKKAAKGSAASHNLAANVASLKKAEKMLAGLKQAKTMMGALCCNNDQGCNFVVFD